MAPRFSALASLPLLPSWPTVLVAPTFSRPVPLVLAVPASSPIKTYADFVEHVKAKSKAGKGIDYGTGGVGALPHVTMELLRERLGFTGEVRAIGDVLQEQAGFMVRSYAEVKDFRRRLGAESIDLLLLDWNLGEGSGLDLLEFRTRGTGLGAAASSSEQAVSKDTARAAASAMRRKGKVMIGSILPFRPG